MVCKVVNVDWWCFGDASLFVRKEGLERTGTFPCDAYLRQKKNHYKEAAHHPDAASLSYYFNKISARRKYKDWEGPLES
jgi:hypothetical protein